MDTTKLQEKLSQFLTPASVKLMMENQRIIELFDELADEYRALTASTYQLKVCRNIKIEFEAEISVLWDGLEFENSDPICMEKIHNMRQLTTDEEALIDIYLKEKEPQANIEDHHSVEKILIDHINRTEKLKERIKGITAANLLPEGMINEILIQEIGPLPID